MTLSDEDRRRIEEEERFRAEARARAEAEARQKAQAEAAAGKMKVKDTAAKGCLGCLGLLVVLFVIGSLVPDSKDRSSSSRSGTESLVTGQGKTISGDSRIGCTDRAYFEKLVSYASQQDREAFSKALAAGVLVGRCTMFKPGESVFIADTAIFSGLVKVRRQGDVAEYWTNIEAVR